MHLPKVTDLCLQALSCGPKKKRFACMLYIPRWTSLTDVNVSLFVCRLSLDGKELYVPALGLNRLPISSSTSPLQSARPQPRGDARAPLQGTENTLSRGLAKAPTVKLPSFKTDGLSAPQLSQPQDPAGYPSEMTVYKLDVLAEGLELPASNFVATKNSRGSRGPAASSLKMEAAECLDVGTENIRLFELKELQSDAEASASCTRFAVQIAGAGMPRLLPLSMSASYVGERRLG